MRRTPAGTSARAKLLIVQTACVAAFGSATLAHPISAQFSDPCGVACAIVLGSAGFTAATGAVVALGRHSGGVSTVRDGRNLWGTTLVVVVGGGIALSGNGQRQRRAVYSAALGGVAGSLVWLGIESRLEVSDRPRKLAAAIMGAAAGVVAGGVFGAVSYDAETRSGALPVFSFSLPLGHRAR